MRRNDSCGASSDKRPGEGLISHRTATKTTTTNTNMPWGYSHSSVVLGMIWRHSVVDLNPAEPTECHVERILGWVVFGSGGAAQPQHVWSDSVVIHVKPFDLPKGTMVHHQARQCGVCPRSLHDVPKVQLPTEYHHMATPSAGSGPEAPAPNPQWCHLRPWAVNECGYCPSNSNVSVPPTLFSWGSPLSDR